MIQLGQKVKDKVSGFTGIVTAKALWLNGCERYVVQPPIDKDGKYVDSVWIDGPQLEVVDENPVVENKIATGGPSKRTEQRDRF